MLPDEDTPVLVYRGVEEGGKVAVFELTGSVTAQGDGGCEPSPEDCQILRLREGETEFITVTDTGTETDAQYQLELEKIYTEEDRGRVGQEPVSRQQARVSVTPAAGADEAHGGPCGPPSLVNGPIGSSPCR